MVSFLTVQTRHQITTQKVMVAVKTNSWRQWLKHLNTEHCLLSIISEFITGLLGLPCRRQGLISATGSPHIDRCRAAGMVHDTPRESGSMDNIHNPAPNPCISKQSEELPSAKCLNHITKHLLLFFPPRQQEDSLKVINVRALWMGGL